MGKIKVGILFGGQSAEHEISLVSAKNVIEAIDKDKYDISLIAIDKQGKWLKSSAKNFLLNSENPALIKLNQSDVESLALTPGNPANHLVQINNQNQITDLDVILPILHGPLGEDGCMQGLLKIMNIPFVGCDVLSSAICMDKDMMKRVLQSENIPSCRYKTLYSYDDNSKYVDSMVTELGLPLFVKPANMGSSIGISKVGKKEDLLTALSKAFQYDQKVIVEEQVIGREIEVAVLGNRDPKASVPGEIVPKDDFYSFEAKYIDDKGADLVIPAKLESKEISAVQELALKAFKAMNCSGMARVDFFYTEDKKWFINELNTIPGFTKISQYPALWQETGLSYSELIDKLLELALERGNELKKLSRSNVD